jgi:hypothetical protein
MHPAPVLLVALQNHVNFYLKPNRIKFIDGLLCIGRCSDANHQGCRHWYDQASQVQNTDNQVTHRYPPFSSSSRNQPIYRRCRPAATFPECDSHFLPHW